MADGITVSNRVDTTTERKLNAYVVDSVLNAVTYFSRLMSMGKEFSGKTMDWTVAITEDAQFEWFVGLETLNSQASDNTITLSYAHTAGTQPNVDIMLESFANAGEAGTIPLEAYKYKEAGATASQKVSSAIYATGTANRPNGLQKIVDDGTNAASIGGQLRATYSALNGTYTSSGGTLTLAKLATLSDAISASGSIEGSPNINDTTKTIWSYYEQLLHPSIIASYTEVGYKRLPVRGSEIVSPAELKGAAGFTALQHRGIPVIKDDDCTSQVWYMLNERTYGWFGRTIVPVKYRGMLEKVDLGEVVRGAEGYQSSALTDMPSQTNGWFYQKDQLLPFQAGMVGRYFVIGQVCTWEPRRNGQLYAITGV